MWPHVWLAAFTQHTVPKVHPHCSTDFHLCMLLWSSVVGISYVWLVCSLSSYDDAVYKLSCWRFYVGMCLIVLGVSLIWSCCCVCGEFTQHSEKHCCLGGWPTYIPPRVLAVSPDFDNACYHLSLTLTILQGVQWSFTWFNLHFSDDCWCWTAHVFICVYMYVCISWGKTVKNRMSRPTVALCAEAVCCTCFLSCVSKQLSNRECHHVHITWVGGSPAFIFY